MPGYNHYLNCGCGWCVKQRGWSSDGSAVAVATSALEAARNSRILRESGADQRRTACFVDPNATCPVCGASVYYYENASGSRVFFDELGPPWPKHPCTDNQGATASYATRNSLSRPTPRKRGAILEILEAAKSCDFDLDQRFQSKYGQQAADFAEVLEVTREGFSNTVTARMLYEPSDESFTFRFTSSKQILFPGQLVPIRDDAISPIDPEKLEPKRYKIEFAPSQ